MVLVSLYVADLSAVLLALAIHKKSDRPLAAYLGTLPGVILVGATLALAATAALIVHYVRAAPPGRARAFAAILTVNLGSVALAFAVAEALVRVFAVPTPGGRVFANTLLLPRPWEQVVAQNRAVLERAAARGTYLVHDTDLGWTIGPGRRSADYNRDFVALHAPHLLGRRGAADSHIYFSSTEGIRSPRAGMSFAALPARPRIALVGDSFTFGLEVRYEDTWGHRLETALGGAFQVLNFGVDGYGVDQAYLRYRRDVVPWRPDVVVLGIINDDLRRTMCVYGFLCHGAMSQMPFPKPRFVLREDRLAALNLPLPTPESLFAKPSIQDLPFIEYDWSFDPVEWEWRFYHHADSIRLLLSRYRRWPVPRPAVSDEALESVNGEIVRAFVRLAREHGSVPIVVYFPSRWELTHASAAPPSVAKGVLAARGIPFRDMTECVGRVSPEDRFVTLHYSPATNAAVAECLRSSIPSSRSRRGGPSTTPRGAATR